jgi:tricorn protease
MLHMLLVALLLAVPSLAQAESRLLRHPTYSNGTVAFSYLGDIWTAKDDGTGVHRLTDHKARDVYPRYSPDGRWIAFSSDRAGNYDVFVVPIDGGRPRQLTFNTVDDTVIGWTPDGRKILFASGRGLGAYPNATTLFEVSLDGGLEQPIKTDFGAWGSYSPDARTLAVTRHGVQWTRKHDRGSNVADLWVMNVASRTFTRLGDDAYKGNYLWPMYGRNGQIYFVADRLPNERGIKPGSPETMKSVNNIWRIGDKGGTPVQVTHHASGNLFFPSMSADGRTIVYEEDFGLWKLDVGSGKSTKIPIDIRSDLKENEITTRVFQGEANGFSVSPSARRVAVQVHGEIYTVATDRGRIQRVTDSAAHDEVPRWSPDGKWIAMISDRTGRHEVWVADELGTTTRQLSDVDCDKFNPVWAPDSKSILWSCSDFTLRRSDIDAGSTEVIASGAVGMPSDHDFSPDGKWVSFTKIDTLGRSHAYVKRLGDATEHALDGDDLLQSRGARWTGDGTKVMFLAIESAPGGGEQPAALFVLGLTGFHADPRERNIDTEAEAQALAARRGPTGTDASKVDVKVDLADMRRRMRRVSCSGFGGVTAAYPSPDGRTILFFQNGQLHTVADDGTRVARVAALGQGPGAVTGPQWARDGRTMFFSRAGGVFSMPVPQAPAGDAGANATCENPATPPVPAARRVDFTIRMDLNETLERQQVFEQAWRVLKHQYYDKNMNGVDWAAAKERFKPLLADVADSEELRTVIQQMAGELNSSHISVNPPEPPQDRLQTWYPGFELVADVSGYVRVGHIFKGGPASHEYLKLQPGQYVLAVNGKPLKASDNYWSLFNTTAARELELTVNSTPALDGARTIVIDPVPLSTQTQLEYQRWVDDKRAIVDRLSGGTVGYLHIRAMDVPSLANFQRDLQSNAGKKALIIDVRFNPGGNTEQSLLAMLNDRAYGSLRPRNSVDVPRAGQRFFGPMVVLHNERSNSDSEMFSQGFRALGLGKLVGVTTPGRLIWTYNTQLRDGSVLRTPRDGVYDASGRNLENLGVEPDVFVDNAPEDFYTGRDRQLEKAVEVVRGQASSSTGSR